MSKDTVTITDNASGRKIELPLKHVPANMFTVMFAIARTVGWVAQWMAMIAEEDQRIGRPRQLYVGPAQRDYVPIRRR